MRKLTIHGTVVEMLVRALFDATEVSLIPATRQDKREEPSIALRVSTE